MARPMIGRTVRRLRLERRMTQQALAVRLGISASYLNLIEHDQRGITAALLLRIAETLRVDLATLSGTTERQLEVQLRETFADPLLNAEVVPDAEVAALAATSPNASRAVLALYRAWRVAREDSGGLSLPSGRRILLPIEEVRDFFNENGNHFPTLEAASEELLVDMSANPAEKNHAIAERLRRRHGMTVTVGPLDGALRRYDPNARSLYLSEMVPRESRGFYLAFQLGLLEARDAVDKIIEDSAMSSPEAAGLVRIGLLNYVAAALLMPYGPFHEAARVLRHDVEHLAARFAVSFEQACQRLSSLQRPGLRGVPFFFLRVDPAGNVSKRYSGAGFPFARYGGSCPRWVVHTALTTPGTIRVQVAQLPDGTSFLCFARSVTGTPAQWGEPPPLHVIAMGAQVAHATEIVYADGIDLERAAVGIGLSCRMCDRQDCRSRAFPPLAHRLALDPMVSSASPYQFEVRRSS